MLEKPELIVISQNLMGGGASFHRNMIENKPDDFFDIKIIYLDPLYWVAKRHENLTLGKNDVIFQFDDEPHLSIASRLNEHISNKEGAIVTNINEELICLEQFSKPNKTVYFICHDEAFISIAVRYSYIIDIIIAHNRAVYNELQRLMPSRAKDILFIAHGVRIQNFEKEINTLKPLNVVFLARHVKIKGIYDIPKINELLEQNSLKVNWTIMGDGEEHQNFIESVKKYGNFKFIQPKETEGVIEVLKHQDIYVLPSSLDGLPVSLLEAMSVGCVPILYNFSEGIKSVVTEEIGYVVDLNDYTSIAHAIINLDSDRKLLSDLSQNCVQKVNSEFNIKHQSKAYFEIYKNYKSHKKKRNLFIKKVIRLVKRNYYLNRIFNRILPV